MELKKNPEHDIHRKRGMFFSIGMICSLSMVIMAFQWTASLHVVPPEEKVDIIDDQLAEAKATHFVTEKEKPKPVQISHPNYVEAEPDAIEIDPTILDLEEPVISEPVVPVAFEIDNPIEISDEPFINAEVMPEPVGGADGFYSTLRKNLKYPALARKHGIHGKVFIEFVIGTKGELSNFRVVKGIGAGCDEEAIRVIKLTQWKPGKQRGIPVKVRKTMPIHFVLQ